MPLRRNLLPCLVLGLLGLGAPATAQTVLFSDDFNSGPSPAWDNAVGGWFTAGGVYDSTYPNNFPPTFSSLPYDLTDFAVKVDVNNLSDGGIWLRSADNQNGILLVTGGYGRTGTGLYWHEIVNGNYGSALNPVNGLFVNGVSSVTLTVTVVGNVYSAYVNGSTTPATTLTSSLFASGRVGLYDFSGQTFDNFSVSVPEPSAYGLIALGLGALSLMRWKRPHGPGS